MINYLGTFGTGEAIPPMSPVLTFRVTWREAPDDSIFEQHWQGTSRAAALRRWRNYWGLRQKDCAEFTAVAVAI